LAFTLFVLPVEVMLSPVIALLVLDVALPR
jgi:hypothetical protein